MGARTHAKMRAHAANHLAKMIGVAPDTSLVSNLNAAVVFFLGPWHGCRVYGFYEVIYFARA